MCSHMVFLSHGVSCTWCSHMCSHMVFSHGVLTCVLTWCSHMCSHMVFSCTWCSHMCSHMVFHAHVLTWCSHMCSHMVFSCTWLLSFLIYNTCICLYTNNDYFVCLYISHSLSELFSEWDCRLSLMGTDFQHIDLILSLRAACINSLLLNEHPPSIYRKEQIYSELYNVLRTKAKLASEAGKYQVMRKCIV